MCAALMRAHAIMVKAGILSSHRTFTRNVDDPEQFAKAMINPSRTDWEGVTLPEWASTPVSAHDGLGAILTGVSTETAEFDNRSLGAIVAGLREIVSSINKKADFAPDERVIGYSLAPTSDGNADEALIIKLDTLKAPPGKDKIRRIFSSILPDLQHALSLSSISLRFGVLAELQAAQAKPGVIAGTRANSSFTISSLAERGSKSKKERGVIVCGHSLYDVAARRYQHSVYEPSSSITADAMVAHMPSDQEKLIAYDPSLDASKHVDGAFVPLSPKANPSTVPNGASSQISGIANMTDEMIDSSVSIFRGSHGYISARIAAAGVEALLLDPLYGDHIYTNLLVLVDDDRQKPESKRIRLTKPSDSGSPVCIANDIALDLLGVIVGGSKSGSSSERTCESYAQLATSLFAELGVEVA